MKSAFFLLLLLLLGSVVGQQDDVSGLCGKGRFVRQTECSVKCFYSDYYKNRPIPGSDGRPCQLGINPDGSTKYGRCDHDYSRDTCREVTEEFEAELAAEDLEPEEDLAALCGEGFLFEGTDGCRVLCSQGDSITVVPRKDKTEGQICKTRRQNWDGTNIYGRCKSSDFIGSHCVVDLMEPDLEGLCKGKGRQIYASQCGGLCSNIALKKVEWVVIPGSDGRDCSVTPDPKDETAGKCSKGVCLQSLVNKDFWLDENDKQLCGSHGIYMESEKCNAICLYMEEGPLRSQPPRQGCPERPSDLNYFAQTPFIDK